LAKVEAKFAAEKKPPLDDVEWFFR
jgi:hypothetical protein